MTDEERVKIEEYWRTQKDKPPMTRLPIPFTEEQKQLIREMVEADKLREAQRLILDKLCEEFEDCEEDDTRATGTGVTTASQ